MPRNQKDLRDAKAGADPDLNFSYNELIDELKAEHDYPGREPGDITPRDMADVTSLTERQWYEILNKKVREGELERVRIKERGQSRSYFVYRRKK